MRKGEGLQMLMNDYREVSRTDIIHHVSRVNIWTQLFFGKNSSKIWWKNVHAILASLD